VIKDRKERLEVEERLEQEEIKEKKDQEDSEDAEVFEEVANSVLPRLKTCTADMSRTCSRKSNTSRPKNSISEN